MWYNYNMIKPSIKEIIKPCLWGSLVDSLDIENDKFLIIERLLEHGGDKQIDFLLSYYSAEDIIQVVKESAYLGPKTANYWCIYFNLKREDTKCFTKPFPHLWPAY
ncbi:MAG: hypothetical protein HZB80_05455 [Deltaproteobacteria bacterium]|nr:hypothetical protein [Deltaproteobacteria bacterium]